MGVHHLGNSHDDLRLQSQTQIVDIVRAWEKSAEAKGMQLLFTVAYDWRRDLWEQAERMAAMVDTVVEETGCKPVIVALSFGGIVTYNAIAWFGKATADKVQGVLYGGVAMQPTASSPAGTYLQTVRPCVRLRLMARPAPCDVTAPVR